MAQLYIYDKFGTLLEQHEILRPLTEWLKENVPAYRERCAPLYSCELNGKSWPYVRHGDNLSADDVISLTIEPQDPVTIILTVIAVASAAYAYSVASNIPQGYEQATEDGSSVYQANARANLPRPSGLVREIAGRMQIFPDLIAPPYRYTSDNYEYLSVLLSLGRGYFDINPENVYISETPYLNYVSGSQLSFYDPGETLTGTDMDIWITSKETADISLRSKKDVKAGVWTADFSTDEITTYFDDGGGAAVAAFPFAVDETFEISEGANVGSYAVTAISGASNETATVVLRKIDQASQTEATIAAIIASRNNTDPVDVTIKYIDDGSPSFAATTGDPVKFEGISGGVNWFGPYKLTEPGVDAEEIEVDFSFDTGLARIEADGTKSSHTVEVAIEYREYGTAVWATQNFSFTDNFIGQRVFTRSITLPSSYEPEMRFRRITRENQEIGYYEDLRITRTKTRLSSPPTSYDDITVMRLDIRGTDNLSSSAQNRINIRNATRKLPTLAELEAAANGTPFDLSRSATTTSGNWNSDFLNFSRSYSIGGDSFPGTSGEDQNSAFSWSPDGMYLLMIGKFGAKCMSAEIAYDPTTLALVGANTFQTSFDSQSQCFLLSSGNYYVIESAKNPDPEGSIKYFTNSTAFNPATATLSSSYDFTLPIEDDFHSLYVTPDGLSVYFIRESGCAEYSMTIANDLTTMSFVASQGTGFGVSAASFSDFDASDLPTKLFTYATGNVRRWDFGTAGDVSTLAEVLSSGETPDVPGSPGSMQAYQNDFFFSYADADQNTTLYLYRTTEFVDTRSTRSIMRFVGNALYDALGSRAATLVNWDELNTLEATLDARSDVLDAEFTDETTLWEAVRIMLSPAYSEPVVKDGAFIPVRTITGTDHQQIYTPDIMTDEGLSIDASLYDSEEPDGVEVEYFSLTTFENETILCLASGDAGINPRRIQAIGVSDETRAWRIGMRERNRARYKPAQFTFSTEMDALNSEYGDPIAVCSEVFASQAGTVTAYSGSTVTLDFEPDFGAGTYYAAFKQPNGKMSGLYTVASGGSPNEITLSSPTTLDFTPITDESDERTLVSIGLTDEWGRRAIVRRIEPQGDNIVQVVAEEYLAEVYQDDDNTPS